MKPKFIKAENTSLGLHKTGGYQRPNFGNKQENSSNVKGRGGWDDDDNEEISVSKNSNKNTSTGSSAFSKKTNPWDKFKKEEKQENINPVTNSIDNNNDIEQSNPKTEDKTVRTTQKVEQPEKQTKKINEWKNTDLPQL